VRPGPDQRRLDVKFARTVISVSKLAAVCTYAAVNERFSSALMAIGGISRPKNRSYFGRQMELRIAIMRRLSNAVNKVKNEVCNSNSGSECYYAHLRASPAPLY